MLFDRARPSRIVGDVSARDGIHIDQREGMVDAR